MRGGSVGLDDEAAVGPEEVDYVGTDRGVCAWPREPRIEDEGDEPFLELAAGDQAAPQHTVPDRALAETGGTELRHRHDATLPRRQSRDSEIGRCGEKPLTVMGFSPHPSHSDADGDRRGSSRPLLHSSMTKLAQSPRPTAVVNAARAPGSASIAASAKSANIALRARSATS